MNMDEYNKVKDMTYLEYCDYLQAKYGIGLTDYYNKNFNKNLKCTRTKEGLVVHHKDEDKMIMLSTKVIAERFPYEWQTKEHLVYCDMLEHLLLHVLICKYPSKDQVPGFDVGIGGASNFIIPELNDVYCGWKSNQKWQQNLHEKIIDDKDVYLAIIEKFIKEVLKPRKCNPKEYLLKSYNEQFGIGSSKAIIADLTGNRGGVYYEAGIATGLQLCNHPIKLFLTCQKKFFDEVNVHFDVSGDYILIYEDVDDLKEELRLRLKTLLAE